MSDDKLIRIENKIDRLDEKLGTVNVILASQHESLKDHIRRTEILEEAIIPLKKHDHMRSGAIKSILFAASILAAVEAVIVILNHLKR